MKILIFTLFAISLFANSYDCSGSGKTKVEAKFEAKKSALAESSTYLKSVFQKNISTENGRKLSYSLQTIAKGICKIEKGKTENINGEIYFQGVCIVENEAITETEKIIRKLSQLKKDLQTNRKNLENRLANLQSQISENRQYFQKEISQSQENFQNQISKNRQYFQKEISKLQNEIAQLPTIEDIKLEDRKIQNIWQNIRFLEKSEKNKYLEITQNISNLTTKIEKLENRVSIVEKKQNYIIPILGVLGLLVIFLLFRRPKKITIEKVADISIVSKKISISTEKKIYYKNEKLKINFANLLDRELYFYIIDINLRDETTLIYPAKSDNNLLSPNSKRELAEINVVPPFGKDILKIIGSPVRLEIPKIVYSKESQVFQDGRGFANPNITNIEKDLAKENIISDKDILAHFRGQALNGGFTLYENFIELETRE